MTPPLASFVPSVAAGLRAAPGDFAPFYAGYVGLVPEDDVLAALAAQEAELAAVVAAVPPEGETHRYAPGKWSVREVIGHVGDGERVFGYRAFCIARGEQASLPGFDEGAYLAVARYDEQPLADLHASFSAARAANRAILAALSREDFQRAGTANGTRITVLALATILAGHARHHAGVLRARYGIVVPS